MYSNCYTIKIPQFEGPFDLLLFFIERDEIDISDIPIRKITQDFLSYIHTMEVLNIDIASEFIVMAATLMQIKTRMLLPRKPVAETGEEEDPREELAQKLKVYQTYKDRVPELKILESSRMQKHARGNVDIDLKSIIKKAHQASELENLSMYRLVSAFERVLKRQEKERHQSNAIILRFDYDMMEERSRIYEKIRIAGTMKFQEIIDGCQDRIEAIVRFLALLDMINERKLMVTLGEKKNQFWIKAI